MIAKDVKLTRIPPLEERIRRIRAEIDAIIDARAEAVSKHSPGVPLRRDPQSADRARASLPLCAISRDPRRGPESRGTVTRNRLAR